MPEKDEPESTVTRLPATPRPSRLRKRPAKVLKLDIETRLNIPPDRVLKAAIGELESVLVIGFDKEGEFYGASSLADGGDLLWLMELCKRALMDRDD